MTIPNGWQTATPISWGIVGDTGKEQFEIEFKTEHGSIRWWGSFTTDNARAYSEKQMRKCGWLGDWAHPELLSEPVSILIEERTHNGKTKQEVKAVGGGGGGVSKPIEPAKAQSFIARMKASGASPSATGGAFANAPEPEWDGTGPDPTDSPPTFP